MMKSLNLQILGECIRDRHFLRALDNLAKLYERAEEIGEELQARLNSFRKILTKLGSEVV